MIYIKTAEEIALMREGGKILAKTLDELSRAVAPGIKTIEIDKLAEGLVLKYGAKSSFKGYKPKFYEGEKGYPASVCVSINEEVVHGIPGERVLKEGDIVSMDMGILYKGFFTDAAITAGAGKISSQARKLIDVTKKSLEIGIKEIGQGKHLGDIGFAIQSYAEQNGFSVVRDLVGHGVGKYIHEDPEIPNYGFRGQGLEFKKGMTLALEPMVNIGAPDVKILPDGWTFVSSDKSLVAHFEHTVAVTENGAEILTKL
ncbi:type I methionyl aminopeptidase [Patescibacteria group bacterium]|nr:type I methionyl aminopeptidase [Patescibacteria group bacterium]MBU4056932.1 type I methionyl aminopeptidase [Patescibacteria group bacterium]MBU4368795.1 type I methionyl aminopeptidase [Patescibacteria group bacterium]